MLANKPMIAIIVGALMLLSGWLISFLMVIKLLEENIYLIISAYSINLSGLSIGLYGVSSYIYLEKLKKESKRYR
mgnify:CR=1 FL=1